MSAPITDTSGGLDHHRKRLDAAVVEEIHGWAEDPELGKLYTSLQAIHDTEKFLDTYAEAMVARHLLSRDCRLSVEVLTPSGRHVTLRSNTVSSVSICTSSTSTPIDRCESG